MDIFLFSQSVGVAQLGSKFISEEMPPRVSVHLVYPWEDVSSGASSVIIIFHISSVFQILSFSYSPLTQDVGRSYGVWRERKIWQLFPISIQYF